MDEVPELAGLEDAAHGLRKLDETPAGRLVRCVDLVAHVMRRDGLGLAEAAGHVVQALASVGDGLELFHLRRGALPAYAARWEPVRWRWSDPGRWNLGDAVPEGYRVRHFTPFDFDERQFIPEGRYPGWRLDDGRGAIPEHLLGSRLVWEGGGTEPAQAQTVAGWLTLLGQHWQARAGLGSLDRGWGEPSSVAVRSSAARAAGLLGTAEVLALPVATVAPVATATPTQWTEADKQDMREARELGESDSSIAKRYGFSRQRLAELIGSRTSVRLQAAAQNRHKAA